MYVVGYTSSTDFPVTAGAFQELLAGGFDGFVVKLDPSGSGLVYGTLLTIASHWSHEIFAPALPEHLWTWGWPFDRIGRRREG